jgi:oxygen-independent coproporphyrinogen III oxidase
MAGEPILGLYLHIPFCSAICNYCNFNRGLFDAELKERYVAALETEIARAADGRRADTIYFGGGTPSLLEPFEIARLIAGCRAAFDVGDDAEVTMEANPETASIARLEGFRRAGVTRLSFGVQSFDDRELARLGRLHDAERARAAVREARAAGFDNISLDLMMWLPQQTVATWRRNVAELIELGPEHASLYILEVYPNAPLRDEMARAGWSQAPDEDAAEMYLAAMEALERAGYTQYEISNVARPGYASRHNLKYWRDGVWLGFGCGAHSTDAGTRWRNVAGTSDYIERIDAGASVVVERRALTSDEREEEAAFTGLRLNEGIDLAAFNARYGVDLLARFGHAIGPFLDAGLLRHEGGRLALTRDGMLLSNELFSRLIADDRAIDDHSIDPGRQVIRTSGDRGK